MIWFNKERKIKMDFIQNFRPTSKIQLLQVCQWYHNGDVKKAQEMFDYYAKNIDLPDFDPVAPSTMEQVKTMAGGLYNWIKENQNEIATGYQFISTIIQNKGILPKIAETAEEALPSINE